MKFLVTGGVLQNKQYPLHTVCSWLIRWLVTQFHFWPALSEHWAWHRWNSMFSRLRALRIFFSLFNTSFPMDSMVLYNTLFHIVWIHLDWKWHISPKCLPRTGPVQVHTPENSLFWLLFPLFRSCFIKFNSTKKNASRKRPILHPPKLCIWAQSEALPRVSRLCHSLV